MNVEKAASADGTTIGFERTGDGPPLVVVVGAFCDRGTSTKLAAQLAPRHTVYRYDRRGRGASSDTAPYSVAREVEDLAAVIAAAGGAAFVYGHSSGAILALEAAAAGVAIDRLVVYEPPYVVPGSRRPLDAGLADRLRQLIQSGQREEAARRFLVDAIEVSPAMMAMIESSPGWPAMVAIAHTLPYDVTLGGNPIPVDQMAKVGIPTLVVDGGASSEWVRTSTQALTDAISGAHHLTIDGADHGVADRLIAPVLTDFFS